MAESKLLDKDLTECGICLMTIEEPKALPCLHSYCLKCLSKWAEGKKDIVRCPICSQEFPIPAEGVKGFITNFVINTLKDRREILHTLHAKDSRIPCSCCGETDNKVEAYCTDCGGFICEDCGRTHRKLLILQDHKPIPFADLQSGKVDIKNAVKQKCCKEHKGQMLQFYCKTCGELICHACAVVDHPVMSHSLVNLKNATKEQRSELNLLMTDCSKVRDMLTDALKSGDQVRDDLDMSLKKAMGDIQQAADVVKAKVIAEIEQNKTELESEIIEAAGVNKKQIEAQKESLQLQQTRVHTALQMATELTQAGSDHDLALVFSSLKNNMSELRKIKPGNVDRTLGNLVFTPNEMVSSPFANLGSLSVGQVPPLEEVKDNMSSAISSDEKRSVSESNLCGVETWKLITQFEGQGKQQLQKGCHAALTSSGDLVVADYGLYGGQVLVFDQSGNFKYSLDTQQGLTYGPDSRPWNVVVTPKGRIFITHCVSHVNVYDINATYKDWFSTKSPSKIPYKTNADLRGLALDNQGCLLVGETRHRYISKHRLNGSHVKSFKVDIVPGYIAVTSTGKIIVSSGGKRPLTAQILDTKGNVLRTLDPPSGMRGWNPYAICCTAGDDVYIANSELASYGGGIYRYSAHGQYIGCITTAVHDPPGVALTENDNKLIVVDLTSVKIFSRR